MKTTVQKLLDSEESAYSISKATDVYSSVIQRLRLGQQSMEDCKFDNIEKLYQYQLKNEMARELNLDRYSGYRENVKAINHSDDINFKFSNLIRNNRNIAMALRSLFRALGIEKTSNIIEDRLLYKMVDLLVLNEGRQVQAVDEYSDIFKVAEKQDQSSEEVERYISAIDVSGSNHLNHLNAHIVKMLNEPNKRNSMAKTSIVRVDISSDVRDYLIILSDDLENVAYINNQIEEDKVKNVKLVQQIIDRTI